MLEKFGIKFTENDNRQLHHMTRAPLTNLDIFSKGSHTALHPAYLADWHVDNNAVFY